MLYRTNGWLRNEDKGDDSWRKYDIAGCYWWIDAGIPLWDRSFWLTLFVPLLSSFWKCSDIFSKFTKTASYRIPFCLPRTIIQPHLILRHSWYRVLAQLTFILLFKYRFELASIFQIQIMCLGFPSASLIFINNRRTVEELKCRTD
jgi:hypothetical protein